MHIQTWKLGLDLGSTLSAVAYCLTSDTTDNCTAGEVRAVQGYKFANRGQYGTLRHREVPTKVRYEVGGNIRYGWDAVMLVERGLDHHLPGLMVDLFKPGFDEKEKTREERRHIEELLVRLQLELSLTKTVDDVVTDYLVKLLDHVKDQLQPYGYRDDDSVQITCTVPAMWSIKARRRTVQAVEKAAKLCLFKLGGNVTVLSEPEAATAYVQRKNDRLRFKRGDTFIVCDAGGVTVDVVTYMVHSEEPLLLKQLIRAEGDFCGSSFLNKGFEAHLRKRVDDVERRTKQQLYTPRLEKDLQNALSLFEIHLKRDYGYESVISDLSSIELGDEIPLQRLTMQGIKSDPQNGLHEDGLVITRRDLEMVFEPILKRCWRLILGHLQSAHDKSHEPTRILLVGGFGESPRLRLWLEERCASWVKEVTNGQKRMPIKVVVPEAPGCAVAEGAIYRALQNGMVKDCISRSSICICSHDPYDPRKEAHEGASFVYDPFENLHYVHNCVRILLRTDQIIPSVGIKKSTVLHRTIGVTDPSFVLTLDIYEMEDENGLDDYPLSHPKNQGYRLLETVEFPVEVEPIRKKLKLTLLGSSTHVDQARYSQNPTILRTDDTITLRRGKRLRRASRRQLNSRAPQTANEDPMQSVDGESHYYWIDYRVEVEFKDELMSYQLLIDGVEDYSLKGSVTLSPSIEAWKE